MSRNIIRSVYFILIFIPLFYTTIATYSYYSATGKYGTSSYKLSTEKNLNALIFPVEMGRGLILVQMVCMFFIAPSLVLLNGVARVAEKRIYFPGKLALVLVGVYLTCFLLLRTDQFGGWYFQYILD